MLEDLTRVLYHESTILSRLDELAHQISWDYRNHEMTVIAVLNGSFMFMGDLLRRIPLPLRVDCLSVASYVGDKTQRPRSCSSIKTPCPPSRAGTCSSSTTSSTAATRSTP